MIKKLQYKFILIMMSIVTLILSVVFASLYISTKNSLVQNSTNMLIQELHNAASKDMPQKVIIESNPRSESSAKPIVSPRLQTLLIEIQADGSYKILKNHILSIEENEMLKVLVAATDSNEILGHLSDYNIRFLKNDTGSLIAFIDTSMENQVLRDLLFTSLSISAVALFLFFVLSLFLSKWAIAPVEDAWEKQKQFIGDASHELKTPLTVIISNAEMLSSSTNNTPKETIRLENILAEGKRMKHLIESMLTLARSDYSHNQILCNPVSLSEIVMDSALLYESEIYDEGKVFSYDVEENITMLGDEDKLRQLVDILLDNARKFTDKNNEISLKLFMDSDKYIHLSVYNQSTPIPKDQLKNIFRRFYRTDPSRENNGGFGLGLSIAHNIVQEHKGKIWAENHMDLGNIFHITLPVSHL